MLTQRNENPRRSAGGAPRQSPGRKAAATPELDAAEDLRGFRGPPGDAGLGLEAFGDDDAGDNPYEALADEQAARRQDGQNKPVDEGECPVTPRSIVEAILFVGHPTSDGLSSRFLAALMRGVRPAEVDLLVAELNDDYARLGCPYTIASAASGYRLVLRDEYMNLREAFYGKVREARLSQTAIDLLAVVAYHQPISREDVLRYCDAATPALLAQLVRRGLLMVERTGPGRTSWNYTTSDRFLEMFGLQSLSDLPRPQGDDLSPA